MHNVGKSLWYGSSLVPILFGITCSQDSEIPIMDSCNSGFHAELSTSSQVTVLSIFFIFDTFVDDLIKINIMEK